MVAQLCSCILFLFYLSFFYLNLLNITSAALRHCTKSLHYYCYTSSMLIIGQVFAGGKFNQKSVEQKKGKFMLRTLTLYQAVMKNNVQLYSLSEGKGVLCLGLLFLVGFILFVCFFFESDIAKPSVVSPSNSLAN